MPLPTVLSKPAPLNTPTVVVFKKFRRPGFSVLVSFGKRIMIFSFVDERSIGRYWNDLFDLHQYQLRRFAQQISHLTSLI
jgi:hypothetical protein